MRSSGARPSRPERANAAELRHVCALMERKKSLQLRPFGTARKACDDARSSVAAMRLRRCNRPAGEVSAMLRPALMRDRWPPRARVGVGEEGGWFRRLHHPRGRCATRPVPLCQQALSGGTGRSPTFQGLRMILVPARASRPPDFGLVPDGVAPSVSPDHNSSCDLDSSLKLRMRGREEKGIRGSGTNRRFHPRCARRNLGLWSAQPTLLRDP